SFLAYLVRRAPEPLRYFSNRPANSREPTDVLHTSSRGSLRRPRRHLSIWVATPRRTSTFANGPGPRYTMGPARPDVRRKPGLTDISRVFQIGTTSDKIVPLFGLLSILKVPFRARIRSLIFTRPSPAG